MSNFADEYDSRTCAEFWDHLLRLEILGSEEEEPQGHYRDPEFKKRVIAQLLRERAAKRESSLTAEWPDAELIRERIVSRGEKVEKWEEEKRVIQNRIDQYRRMIERDKEFLRGPFDKEI